jgi:hypothetical protein
MNTNAPSDPSDPQPPSLDIGHVGDLQSLSPAEAADYRACEAVIEGVIAKGWQSLVEAGAALDHIREKELFRDEFDTFEQYYQTKWHFEHAKAYRLMAAARIAHALGVLPGVPQPDHESQIRPLMGLTFEQVLLAWQSAVQNAGGREITARVVTAAVKQLQFTSQEQAERAQKQSERAERFRTVIAGIQELLELIAQKAPHDQLLSKAEALQPHFAAIFLKRQTQAQQTTCETLSPIGEDQVFLLNTPWREGSDSQL